MSQSKLQSRNHVVMLE